MRAWYGRGRFWFVVAPSSPNWAIAWGWYGCGDRWEPLGRELVDWVETDFADAIDAEALPTDLLITLLESLGGDIASYPAIQARASASRRWRAPGLLH